MSLPTVFSAVFCLYAGLLSLNAMAAPLDYQEQAFQGSVKEASVAESSRYQEPETRTLSFVVELEIAGESHRGQLAMSHETFLNGSVLQLSSHFPSALPDTIRLPAQERVIEEDGVVTSSVMTTPEDDVGSARMHTYGTFAHLGRLVGVLADRHRFGHIDGSDREYQSAFLLLEKPASVRNIDIDANAAGRVIELAMSNDSTITYQLDTAGDLVSIEISDGNDTKVTYTVSSSLE